jgi:hypothetical protein
MRNILMPNKIGGTNRRPTFPLNAGGAQFASTQCAQPFLSAAAAAAKLYRWPEKRREE